VSQQAVSARIRAMEAQTGVPLTAWWLRRQSPGCGVSGPVSSRGAFGMASGLPGRGEITTHITQLRCGQGVADVAVPAAVQAVPPHLAR